MPPEEIEQTQQQPAPAPQATPVPQPQTQQTAPVQQQPPQPAQEEAKAPHEALLSAEATGRYTDEIVRDGKLSEASYAELQRGGFPREMVDTYLRGIQAAQNESMGKAYETVGGKERYDSMVAWAAKSLSAEQKKTFNTIFATGDQMAINMGLTQLNDMFSQAVPQPPQTQISGNAPTQPSAGDVFTSRAEMAHAMTDEKYWNDPATQRAVQEKIKRSVAAGMNLN